MKTLSQTSWPLRLITLTVWLVAVLCGAYWALKFVTVQPVGAASAAAPAVVVDSLAVARLLGATDFVAGQAGAMPTNSNYALFGLAVTGPGEGVALIAIDGKPAKPYRVGSQVAEDLVLKSVSRTEAILAKAVNAPDGMKLELPTRHPATMVVSAPASGSVQFQPAPPVAAPPGTVTPQVIGLGASMAYATNPAMPSPSLAEALAQRPVSRFAPPPGSQGTSGGTPLAPPSVTSAVTAPPSPKP